MIENPAVKDVRSGKLIFLSHCCLNQNAKVRGLATDPGAIRALVDLLMDHDVGMFQMTCPETTYMGSMRWGQVYEQFHTPMFRAHCRKIAESVADMAENYLQNGYQVLGFVMVEGSPVCGLSLIPRPTDRNMLWGGMNWYKPESALVEGKGNYCEILQEVLAERFEGRDFPFVGYPEIGGEEAFTAALKQIEALL